ncbi:Dak1-domain-containing protein [Aspergillus germanicus]
MESRRSFIQDPARLVKEWTSAQLLLQPSLQFDERASVLFKKGLNKVSRVTVISGGGSGHEPAHFGYIGDNLLDAAVTGALFASPNARQIYKALELAASPKGTIVIVKNYTGDKLNFALAVEQFKANTGRNVHIVLVGDDVSVPRSRGAFVGRRGLAGTILMHKIAGAAASRGFEIERIVRLCDRVSRHMGTIGASLEHCYVPGQPATAQTGMGEILMGVGIHNEPPIRRLPTETSTEEVIQAMLDLILNAEIEEHGFLGPDATEPSRRLVLLVNNLGGLSAIEMGSLTAMTCAILNHQWGIAPCRIFCGTYLSALDGRGFSITLLSLAESEDGPLILSLLNDPTNAIGWSSSGTVTQWELEPTNFNENLAIDIGAKPQHLNPTGNYQDERLISMIVESILSSVTSAEPMITRYDMVLGDGDCGTTLLTGARAMKQALENGSLASREFPLGIKALADVVIDAMGGTSGAIHGIYLTAFAAALNRSYKKDSALDAQLFAAAASEALEVLFKFTGARVGDRTLMDALIPFVTQLQKSKDKGGNVAFREAFDCAVCGCESTRQLEARFGRSTYVNEMAGMETVDGGDIRRLPDPGACGIIAVLTGIQKALSS